MTRYRIVVEKMVTEVYEIEAPSELEAVQRLRKERPAPTRVGSTASELGQIVAVVALKK
jgi:hypothetical protein